MSEYRPRTYLNRVLAASTATHSAAHVLRVMCWKAEFDRPEVTITKQQIAIATGYHNWTVREALRFLESEGSIEVIRNGLGGRSNAPTYRLLIADKGVDIPHKGVGIPHKGVGNPPPTIDSIDSMSDGPALRDQKRAAAGRGGRGIKRGDYRPSGKRSNGGKFAEKQQSKILTAEQKAEVDRFTKAMKHGGTYGQAKALIEAWDKGEVPEPPE